MFLFSRNLFMFGVCLFIGCAHNFVLECLKIIVGNGARSSCLETRYCNKLDSVLSQDDYETVNIGGCQVG